MENPVYLNEYSGHRAWVNRKALEMAGITSLTDGGVERENWALYNDVYNECFATGEWTCRVNMLLAPLGINKISPTTL